MILVLGDAMIDRYWMGEVERISPEAPVPVVAVQDVQERRGGAANVLDNCLALGGLADGIFSPSFDDRPIEKLRVIARQQQVVRLDFDHPQAPISLALVKEMAPAYRVAVVSDYGKGALREIYPIMQALVQAGCKVLVDPKGYRYGKYQGAYLVKPNTHEMKELVGPWEDDIELEDKVREMMTTAGIQNVLLTRGHDGMSLYQEDRAYHMPTKAQEVYDVSGAGDTAIATLAVCLDRDMSLPEACEYANKAAGIAVGHFGTYVANKQEVFG